MTTHTYSTADVPVDGGTLRVGVWDPIGLSEQDMSTGLPDSENPRAGAVGSVDPPAILLIHGITASHRAWDGLIGKLAGCRVVAPDIRGRGRSNVLGAPFGMVQHAADAAAVVRDLVGGPVTVVGHSMGGWIAAVLAHRHPELVARLIVVDGGLPIPLPSGLPDGATADEVVSALLGPALERLSQVFESREAYRDFWRQHPAFAEFTPLVEQYVDYDLAEYATKDGIELRPATSPEAAAADSADAYTGKSVPEALAWLGVKGAPVTFLRAERGLFDQPEAMYPPEVVAEWCDRLPNLTTRDVADTNHYTIIMSDQGTTAVANAIAEGVGVARSSLLQL